MNITKVRKDVMIRKSVLCTALAFVIGTTASCASKPDNHDQHVDYDRFETYNRAMFKFNYQFDKYILKPVAEGYRAVTNDFTRERVRSVISNIKEPVYAGNNLLQGDIKQSGIGVARFGINSTLGLLGMFDVAEGWGLKKDAAGFDETLAAWCVPDGPFIVLPFAGPSTPRAAVGMFADGFMNPVYWATYQDANVHDKAIYTYIGVQAIALREANIELLDDLERGSVDFYSTMRSAYLQNRKTMGCNAAENTQSYDFDFGIEDEDDTFDEMEAQ